MYATNLCVSAAKGYIEGIVHVLPTTFGVFPVTSGADPRDLDPPKKELHNKQI